MLSSVTMNMNQLKPMIIVLLMLTSALAGCAGDDTSDLEQQIADLQQSNDEMNETINQQNQDYACLLYTSPSPRDLSTSRMPSSA